MRKRPDLAKRNTTHGLSKSSEYKTWCDMKRRCYSPHSKDAPLYKDKGIKICKRWINSFENFYKDMGKKPSLKHSIDRIDSNKDYKPSNCRWATPKEQANNTSRSRKLTFKGQTLSLTEWSTKMGFTTHKTVSYRLNAGWTVKEALTIPIYQKHKSYVRSDGSVRKAREYFI